MKKKDTFSDMEEDDIIDFNELEEDIKEGKDVDSKEIERNFIFIIPEGCPICGDEVKGNDHYLYFCKNCNVLFERKDIMDKEFGRKPLSKIRLSEKQREELQRKREELKEHIHKTFSEKETPEEETPEEEAPKEGPATTQKHEEEPDEEDIQEDDVQEEDTEDVETEIVSHDGESAPSLDDLAGAISVPAVHEVEPEEEDTDEKEPAEDDDQQEDDEKDPDDDDADEEEVSPDEEVTEREEYDLESSDKIIASNQSTKMHKGDCHFVKKIHPENRIYLDSITHGEDKGYEMCVCLRRLKAMKR